MPETEFGKGVVLILDGFGLPPELSDIQNWADRYQDHVLIFPDVQESQPGQRHWRLGTPEFVIDLCGLLHSACHEQHTTLFCLALGRFANWATDLAQQFPHWFDGVFLVGCYPFMVASNFEQVVAANKLLRLVPRTVILHSINDEFGGPSTDPLFWQTILFAKVGEGCGEKKKHILIQTEVCSNSELRRIAMGRCEDHKALFARLWTHMLPPEHID